MGALIMLGTLFGLIVLIFTLVLRYDPQTRSPQTRSPQTRSPQTHDPSKPETRK
jgi:hypothetical protein